MSRRRCDTLLQLVLIFRLSTHSRCGFDTLHTRLRARVTRLPVPFQPVSGLANWRPLRLR